MHRLAFITICMGRLAHLQQTLPRLVAQAGTECVVVDYSCPERCGDWAAAHHPSVRVVRVPGREHFSVSEARNHGAAATSAAWLCFVDADVLVDRDFARIVVPELREHTYYRAEPQIAELGGTMLCPRADFERAGGYDEIMRGWGREDFDLYDRFDLLGLARGAYNARLVTPIRHDDALRVQHHGIKDRAYSASINHIYSRIKVDLMRLSQVHPSRELRAHIYEQVRDLLAQGQRTPGELTLNVDYARLGLANGWTATAQVRIVLHERPPVDS